MWKQRKRRISSRTRNVFALRYSGHFANWSGRWCIELARWTNLYFAELLTAMPESGWRDKDK